MRHCTITCLVRHLNEYNLPERDELMRICSSDFPGATIPASSVLWCHTEPVMAFFAEARSKKRIDSHNSDC